MGSLGLGYEHFYFSRFPARIGNAGNVLAVLELLATARQFTICGSDSCLFLGWFV